MQPSQDITAGYANKLILTIGLLLISIGLALPILLDNKFGIIFTSIGGSFTGLGASWMLDEYFRKKGDRRNAQTLFEEAVNLIDRTINKSIIVHKEEDIKFFRQHKFYFYYSTKSSPDEMDENAGKLFWNHTVLDFSHMQAVGRLNCKADFLNINREPYTFNCDLFQVGTKDPIIMVTRMEGTKEAISVVVLQNWNAIYTKRSYGLMFHDDWGTKMRLSPAILSIKPLFDVTEIGPLNPDQAVKAQETWDKHFKDCTTLFEHYSKEKKENSTT